jgi:hypothetical protein
MSVLKINGERLSSATITIPRYGMFVADISMASATALARDVKLEIGTLALTGYAFRMSSFAGTRSARVLGGFGGWRRKLKPRGYSHQAGVKLSTVLTDAARELGEQINVVSDRVIGTAWARERNTGRNLLNLVAPRGWWIDPAGVTQVGPRTGGLITSPFTVNSWSGGRGRFEISTEAYADWLPGRKFSAPTVTTEQTISMVQITADNEGRLRTVVLSGENTDDDRMLDELRTLIQEQIPSQTFAGLWEYTIQGVGDGTVDLVPDDPNGPLPPLTNVPLLPGLLSESVTPTPGDTAIVAFLSRSPAKARVVAIDGSPLTSKIDATATVKLGAGAIPVARAGDLAGGIWPIVPTQVKVLA